MSSSLPESLRIVRSVLAVHGALTKVSFVPPQGPLRTVQGGLCRSLIQSPHHGWNPSLGRLGREFQGWPLFGAQHLASTRQTGGILGGGVTLSLEAGPQGGLSVLLLGHVTALRTWPVSSR